MCVELVEEARQQEVGEQEVELGRLAHAQRGGCIHGDGKPTYHFPTLLSLTLTVFGQGY